VQLVVSLTGIEERRGILPLTMASVAEQTRRPDCVVAALPYDLSPEEKRGIELSMRRLPVL
jgi:hypothetical protein